MSGVLAGVNSKMRFGGEKMLESGSNISFRLFKDNNTVHKITPI